MNILPTAPDVRGYGAFTTGPSKVKTCLKKNNKGKLKESFGVLAKGDSKNYKNSVCFWTKK